ncbi:MAG TPA: sulfur carrier protein ThiS [Acidimicrobiales bacterium]|nr:sulfur carrier protein ThiS [Acidimicrobiales bacterium]
MRVNGDVRTGGPVSVRGLLDELHLDGRGVAVARNGEIVPRSTWESEMLRDDDVIEIVTAAAGG